MPTYDYKCFSCGYTEQVFLQMSFDPKKVFCCNGEGCHGQMRRIILSAPTVKGLKEFAGDWFKKQYGFELGEKDATRAEEYKKIAADKRKLEKEGVKFGKNVPPQRMDS